MAKKRGHKKTAAKKAAPAKASSITDSINSEVIAAALSSVQPVFLKVCRLCEAKDGPFLNIFDPDMITAKKIEVVMPFCVSKKLSIKSKNLE